MEWSIEGRGTRWLPTVGCEAKPREGGKRTTRGKKKIKQRSEERNDLDSRKGSGERKEGKKVSTCTKGLSLSESAKAKVEIVDRGKAENRRGRGGGGGPYYVVRA